MGISCGMAPEGRYVLKRARSEAANYLKTYGEAIPGYLLAERTGAFMHLFTQYGSVRPLGCALLIANCDEADGPTLYSCEACGTVQKWFGKAFGKGRQLANTEIEKLNLKTLTCEQMLFHCAKIFQKIHDETTPFEMEVNFLRQSNEYEHEVVAQDKLTEALNVAKAALEEDEDADMA